MGFVSDTFPLYDVLASRVPATGFGNEYLQSQCLSRVESRIKVSLGNMKPYLSEQKGVGEG